MQWDLIRPDKTGAMVFSSSGAPSNEFLSTLYPLSVGGTKIDFSDTIKDLGLILDRTLS